MKYLICVFLIAFSTSCAKEAEQAVARRIKLIAPNTSSIVRPGDVLYISWNSEGVPAQEYLTLIATHRYKYDNMQQVFGIGIVQNTGSAQYVLPVDADTGKWVLKLTASYGLTDSSVFYIR